MQRFSENQPRIMHSANAGDRAIFSFHTQPGARLLRGGIEVSSDSIARLSKHHSYFQQSLSPALWGSMSLAVDDMPSIGAAIAGCDLTPPPNEQIITPLHAAMAKLQRLHAAAGHLAETAPEVLNQPEAARGLEQALIEALVACVMKASTREERSAHRRHELIMKRFRRVIEEHPDEALFLPEICRAIRVPARTLNLCCREHLGMSPKQYLLKRRMDFARRDLNRAAPGATTVTEVASRYGFWEFGYFASAYKMLFDELPSSTLQRSP